MAKIVQFKTKTEEDREKCIRILEVMLAKAKQCSTVGVAVVTVDADGDYHTNWSATDCLQLLGGLTRMISDINRLMDADDEVDA